jgi:hypothetical protein
MLTVLSYCWSERTSLANSRWRGGSGRKRAFHEQQPIAQVVGHVKRRWFVGLAMDAPVWNASTQLNKLPVCSSAFSRYSDGLLPAKPPAMTRPKTG